MIGLLNAVQKYPIGDINPLENFVTEVFTHIIKNDLEFAEFILNKIFDHKVNNQDLQDLRWNTQYSIENYFLDIIAENDNIAIFFENKIQSKFGENQIGKYLETLKKLFPRKRIYGTAIAAYAIKNEDIIKNSEDAMVAHTWSEISKWIEEYLKNNNKSDNDEDNEHYVKTYLIYEFYDLLMKRGLGPMHAIENDVLKSYCKLVNVEPSIIQLFSYIYQKYDWNEIYKKVDRTDGNKEPSSVRNRWNRIGIELTEPKDWNPGLFFGVILNGIDHKIEPSNPEKGPDLCLIVSFNYERYKKNYREKSAYSELKEDLKTLVSKIGNNWEFFDHISKRDKGSINYWHPLYIRQPLSSIIASQESFEGQAEVLLSQMDLLFNSILGIKGSYQSNSFMKLKEQLRNK